MLFLLLLFRREEGAAEAQDPWTLSQLGGGGPSPTEGRGVVSIVTGLRGPSGSRKVF